MYHNAQLFRLIYLFTHFFKMCASVLPELWMVSTYMPGALGDQVKVLGALELEVDGGQLPYGYWILLIELGPSHCSPH